jgi:hypothetical protein
MLAPTDLLSESPGSAAATTTHLQDRPHLVGWCNGQQRNRKHNCAHNVPNHAYSVAKCNIPVQGNGGGERQLSHMTAVKLGLFFNKRALSPVVPSAFALDFAGVDKPRSHNCTAVIKEHGTRRGCHFCSAWV